MGDKLKKVNIFKYLMLKIRQTCLSSHCTTLILPCHLFLTY